MEKSRKAELKKLRILNLLAVFGVVLVCSALIPNAIRARAQGRLTACKSNLKNIGTALEMYSTDFGGHYPRKLSTLVPNYLKSLPLCPDHKKDTYTGCYLTGRKAPYNTENFADYYLVYCRKGNPGVSIPPGYPQYNAISGLIER